MVVQGRMTWVSAASWATLGAVTVLAIFVVIELTMFADAGATSLARLHFARGIAASLAAIGVSAVFVHRLLERERIRAAERFRFLDRLPVATFVLTAEGTPHYANDAALDLLGRGVIPVAGKAELSIVYPSVIAGTDEPYPPERMPIVRALGGETSSVDDVELVRNGRRVPIEAIATPVHDDEGRISHSIAVFFDITDRKRAAREHAARIREEEARKLQERLVALHTQFLNHAAHQLVTPLTPIRLEVQRLAKFHGDVEVGRIERNVERLADLVQGVLRVSEIEAMTAHAPQEARLQDIVDRAVAVARRPSDVGVVVEVGDVVLECNAPLLQEGLAALIANALAHAGDDTVWVSADDGESIQIMVHDNGEGWAGHVDPAWFEPFHQGHDRQDIDVGWGLGLYVAKVAAQAHGGHILAESPGPGKGATFTIVLPRRA